MNNSFNNLLGVCVTCRLETSSKSVVEQNPMAWLDKARLLYVFVTSYIVNVIMLCIKQLKYNA